MVAWEETDMRLRSLTLKAALLAGGMSLLAGAALAADDACTTAQPGALPADSAAILQKELPPAAQAGFEGYGSPVVASPYVNFKPPHAKPWVIGYNNSFSGNAWRAAALAELKKNVEKYKKLGLVKDLVVTDSNADTPTQIQQMRSMIQKGVDVIISIPGSPTAMNAVIDEAFQAGIPVLTLASPVTTPNAINIDTNGYLIGKTMALGLAQILGGKGNILTVEGIPGTSGSELIKAGGRAVFKNCPNIKIVADLVGQWSESAAQTAVLQELSTDPTAIDGVWQQGSMFMGVVTALKQAGRPIVPVTVGNPNQNSLAYWHDNVSKGFKTAGTSNAPAAGMELVFRTAVRVMMGQGLKVSGVVVRPPLITADTLDQWWKPEFTVDSTGVGEPPPNTWMTDSVLDGYFANPSPLPQ
jgi:ribose transport system substrate-binding protein